MTNNIPYSTHRVICPDPQGSHTIVYTQWGEPDNSNVLICLHGLTQNGRDFDNLASALSTDYRVLCIDIAGRGQSDWLSQPENYTYQTYLTDMLVLLEHLHLTQVDVVGTSMGGLMGMFLAARPASPIRKLVMNDTGAVVPGHGIQRVAHWLQRPPPQFATVSEAENYFRTAYLAFGSLNLPDSHCQQMTRHGIRPIPEGGYRLHYDPALRTTFVKATLEGELKGDIELWPVWAQVQCPVLVLHGANSEMLSAQVIQEMQARHPLTQTVTFPEVGHPPLLMNEEQIAVVKSWLLD